MEKPLLTLSTKEFLTGLSYGAHLGTGGVFYKADGISPLSEPGTAQSTKNGLLMAGSAATTVAGTITGNILGATSYTGTSATTLYLITSGDKVYKLTLDATLSNTLTDTTWTVSSARHGIVQFSSSDGSQMVFYFQNAYIGRGVVESATNNSNWATISSDDIHCAHNYFDQVLFGNSGYVGKIFDDGAGLATSGSGNLNKLALDISTKGRATDISDDGIYAIIAASKNASCDTNALAGSTILFWDGYSPSWLREYEIPDPFIFSLEHTPFGVFAIGVTGIWQVAFGMEPRRVLPIATGIYSVNTANALQYGRGAVSHFSGALVWGGTSGSNKAIKTLGKLDASAPTAYLHPFLSTASKNITFVDGQLAKGYVLVGDDTPQLKGYPLKTGGTPQTGNSAQTAYISLPYKTLIKRIDLIFGEPLASGDAISATLYKDEDTAAISYGSASFASDGAVRRKSLFASVECDHQFSIAVSFDTGAVALRAIEVYGDMQTV